MIRTDVCGRRPVTQVAVGVLVRDDGAVLLADRPAGKPYAGHWEFPGGKIEAEESVEQALTRELREELDVQVLRSDPWVVMEYDYPHAYVRLHFRRIFAWSGTPRAVEGQHLWFLAPGASAPTPLLPAASPALRWIQLATVSGFSPGTATLAADALAWLDGALGRGLRQILWYEPRLDDVQLAIGLPACAARARAYGARLLVDARSARRYGPEATKLDGIFLSAAELRSAGCRPSALWVGAEVEARADLDRAAALGCDFAVFAGEGASGESGWPLAHADLSCDSPLPLYVVQPLSPDGLERALRAGAHGLALRDLPRE